MRPRFSIRGLSALVLLLAFGFAALRGATLGWATTSILLALMALCTSTLGAIIRRGPSRPVWIGFAIFGWAYFLLHFGPWAEWKRGYNLAHFTTWAIDGLLLSRLAPELEEGNAIGGVEELVRVRPKIDVTVNRSSIRQRSGIPTDPLSTRIDSTAPVCSATLAGSTPPPHYPRSTSSPTCRAAT